MKASKFIVPAVFTLAAGFAFADDDYKKFDEADLNKDGKLSMEEARAALPGLETVMTSSGASSVSSDAELTREQVARALPNIEFDNETGPVTEEDYDKIVEELQDMNVSATTSTSTRSSPAGATGQANQSQRGATQSSTNSNSPRTTGSSPSQSGAQGASDDRTRIPGERPVE